MVSPRSPAKGGLLPMVLSRRAARCRLVGPTVLAVVAIFVSPAPAGATPYTVATEQLVVQLGQSASETRRCSLEACRELCRKLLPGQRWSTDLPDAEAVYAESELSGRPGVNYVSPIGTSERRTWCPTTPVTTRRADRQSRSRWKTPSLGRGRLSSTRTAKRTSGPCTPLQPGTSPPGVPATWSPSSTQALTPISPSSRARWSSARTCAPTTGRCVRRLMTKTGMARS